MIAKRIAQQIYKSQSKQILANFCSEQKVHDFSDKHQVTSEQAKEQEHQDKIADLQREWQKIAEQKEAEQITYLQDELTDKQKQKVEFVASALIDLNMLESRYLTTVLRQKIIKSTNIDLMKLNTDWPAIKQLEQGTWPPSNPNWFNQQEAIAKLWPMGQQGMSELFGNVFGGGMVAAAPAGGAPAAGAAAGGDAPAAAEEKAPEEKQNFNVELAKFDAASKIKIIKEVRTILGLGLKDAKDMVEKVPCVLKKGLRKPEADELKEKLEKIGCTINLL